MTDDPSIKAALAAGIIADDDFMYWGKISYFDPSNGPDIDPAEISIKALARTPAESLEALERRIAELEAAMAAIGSKDEKEALEKRVNDKQARLKLDELMTLLGEIQFNDFYWGLGFVACRRRNDQYHYR